MTLAGRLAVSPFPFYLINTCMKGGIKGKIRILLITSSVIINFWISPLGITRLYTGAFILK